MRLLPVSVAIMSLLAAPAAMSAVVTFDFEGEAAGVGGPSRAITVDGVTMTVSRIGGVGVEVSSVTGAPASFGTRALSPFNDINGGAFLLSFSSSITAISVDVGDFAPSDGDNFSLTVGGAVASGSQLGSQGFPFFSTLSLTNVGGTQAILSGGSLLFPESVFWDNIVVVTGNQPVPVPATLALTGLGLVLLGMQRRRA